MAKEGPPRVHPRPGNPGTLSLGPVFVLGFPCPPRSCGACFPVSPLCGYRPGGLGALGWLRAEGAPGLPSADYGGLPALRSPDALGLGGTCPPLLRLGRTVGIQRAGLASCPVVPPAQLWGAAELPLSLVPATSPPLVSASPHPRPPSRPLFLASLGVCPPLPPSSVSASPRLLPR